LKAPSATIGSEPWILQIGGAPIDLPLDRGGPLSERLTSLDENTVAELKGRDLQVMALTASAESPNVLDRAADLIRVAPQLEAVVRRCVQEILVLKAPDDSFDISHSEPRWASRIFISVPASSFVADLRVAEAVVHEAMHLNLTFLEKRLQLVASTELLYSPWKFEERPASGVLHGLYVFACIYRFFAHVSQAVPLDDRKRCHVEQRIAEIQTEVGSIDRRSLLQCLTSSGRLLARNVFDSINRR
jgi:HEXXH motif-containing protein